MFNTVLLLLAGGIVGIFANLATPFVRDWWSSLSRRSLERHVSELERQLTRPTIFEDIVVMCLRRLFVIIPGLFLPVLILLIDVLQRVQGHHFPILVLPPWGYALTRVTTVLVLGFCVGLSLTTHRVLTRGRLLREGKEQDEFQNKLKARIEHLKSKL